MNHNQNRFMRQQSDGTMAFMRPVIDVRTIKLSTGEEYFALFDNSGLFVSFYELLEILTAVKPFYDTFSDKIILEHNQKIIDSWDNGDGNVAPTEKPARRTNGFIYILQAGPYFKIGIAQNVDARIKQLATLPPFDLVLVHTIETEDMYSLESGLHSRFEAKRKNGEWFELDEEDVEWIRGL